MEIRLAVCVDIAFQALLGRRNLLRYGRIVLDLRRPRQRPVRIPQHVLILTETGHVSLYGIDLGLYLVSFLLHKRLICCLGRIIFSLCGLVLLAQIFKLVQIFHQLTELVYLGLPAIGHSLVIFVLEILFLGCYALFFLCIIRRSHRLRPDIVEILLRQFVDLLLCLLELLCSLFFADLLRLRRLLHLWSSLIRLFFSRFSRFFRFSGLGNLVSALFRCGRFCARQELLAFLLKIKKIIQLLLILGHRFQIALGVRLLDLLVQIPLLVIDGLLHARVILRLDRLVRPYPRIFFGLRCRRLCRRHFFRRFRRFFRLCGLRHLFSLRLLYS